MALEAGEPVGACIADFVENALTCPQACARGHLRHLLGWLWPRRGYEPTRMAAGVMDELFSKYLETDDLAPREVLYLTFLAAEGPDAALIASALTRNVPALLALGSD